MIGASKARMVGANGIAAPLRHATFRRIWLASVLPKLGILIQGVGAAWAMTQMASSADKVALVQTALSLPVTLIAMPAGAIADMYDWRIVALVALGIAFAGATALASLAWLGLVTPNLLLALCFADAVQGTLGVAPPDGFFPPLSPSVTSSVTPGPHGGNLDLRELTEGSTLYLPVWQKGALIYTGDSHAVQGGGEISLTALETRMQEVLIEVLLHKQKNCQWPIAETATHWITMRLDKDLNTAMTIAARNAIAFLASRARLTPHDAHALCSIAVSFRVTQVVDIVRGVHAMIPKNLFTGELRQQIAVV